MRLRRDKEPPVSWLTMTDTKLKTHKRGQPWHSQVLHLSAELKGKIGNVSVSLIQGCVGWPRQASRRAEEELQGR